MDTTTIEIKVSTRNALKALGRKGETYDGIIVRLLSSYSRKGR